MNVRSPLSLDEVLLTCAFRKVPVWFTTTAPFGEPETYTRSEQLQNVTTIKIGWPNAVMRIRAVEGGVRRAFEALVPDVVKVDPCTAVGEKAWWREFVRSRPFRDTVHRLVSLTTPDFSHLVDSPGWNVFVERRLVETQPQPGVTLEKLRVSADTAAAQTTQWALQPPGNTPLFQLNANMARFRTKLAATCAELPTLVGQVELGAKLQLLELRRKVWSDSLATCCKLQTSQATHRGEGAAIWLDLLDVLSWIRGC